MHPLTALLRAVRDNRTDLTLSEFSDAQINWAVESGWGPLLLRHVADTPSARGSPGWLHLTGADLTARIIAAEQLDALERIVRECAGRTKPATLLKGISVSEQFYPEPHLRPMRDIDFLVDEDDIPLVQAALFDLGYRRPLGTLEYTLEFYASHHHTAPLWHPDTGIWIEIHRALCSKRSPIAEDPIFSLERVNAERVLSAFRQQAVYRLSAELQIVYLASHWAYDFKRVGGLIAALDMIYLLKGTSSVRWELLLDWLNGAVAASPVYLLLAYLDRRRFVDLPPGLIDEIRHRQRSFGWTSLRIAHTVMDRYVAKGKEFNSLESERNIQILWQTLLLPRQPLRKFLLVLWRLLPSRAWFSRLILQQTKPKSTPDTR
jgi:hypothetical protein